MKKIIAALCLCLVGMLTMGQAIKKEIQTTPFIDGLLAQPDQASVQTYIGASGSSVSGTNTWLATMAPLALNTAQTNTYTNGVIVEATVGLQTLLSTDVAKVVAMVETNSGSGAFVIKDIAMFGGIAASNQNTLVYTVPPNCRHYLTNLSAGTSIATVITNWIDQLITAGPTGATGPALGNTNGIAAGFNVPAFTNFGPSQLVGSIDAQGSVLVESTFSAPFGLSTLFRTTNTSWLTVGGIQTNLGAFYLKQTFSAGLTNLSVDANGQIVGVAAPAAGGVATALTNGILASVTTNQGAIWNTGRPMVGNILYGTNSTMLLNMLTSTNIGVSATFPSNTWVTVEVNNTASFALSVSNGVPMNGTNIPPSTMTPVGFYLGSGILFYYINGSTNTFPSEFSIVSGTSYSAVKSTNAQGNILLTITTPAAITNNLAVSTTFTNNGVYMPVSSLTTSNIDWQVADIFTNKIAIGTAAVGCLFSNVTANRSIIVAFVNVTNDASLSWPTTVVWYGDPVLFASSNSTTFVGFNTIDGKTNGFLIAGGRASSNFTAYAAGTAYSLTATPALLDFGTTDPTITINTAGTYLIQANVGLKYNGATFGGTQTATLKLRKTSGTPADITSGSRTLTLGIVTGLTGSIETTQVPPVIFTAAAGDIIQVFGSLSATPSAGTVDTDSAEIVAVRLK